MSTSGSLIGEPYMPDDAALADAIRQAIADGEALRGLEPRLVKIFIGCSLPGYEKLQLVSGDSWIDYAGEGGFLSTDLLFQNTGFAAAAWRFEREYRSLGRSIADELGLGGEFNSAFLLLLPGMALWVDDGNTFDDPEYFADAALDGGSVIHPALSTGTAHERLQAEQLVRRYFPALAQAYDKGAADSEN